MPPDPPDATPGQGDRSAPPLATNADAAPDRGATAAGTPEGASPAAGAPEGASPAVEASADAGRRSERLTINKEFASFDEFLDAYVTNVSSGGVFIRTRQPLPVGTTVDLHFTVIADGLELIEGVGEVVRVDDNPAGMGVAFRELAPSSRALLDRLLAGRP
ncbi:MAG: PilZ domain-containing protein [Polyangiaceae bacterium]|jgi:uncharacterized protein (TIGR02266 family)|nr:PilZ domain-containing protein [Polyangiaceae bacterium]